MDRLTSFVCNDRIWAPECPNYFIYNGPNCPIGHGSLMACMDVATEYIFRWADKIAKQNIKYALLIRLSLSTVNMMTTDLSL